MPVRCRAVNWPRAVSARKKNTARTAYSLPRKELRGLSRGTRYFLGYPLFYSPLTRVYVVSVTPIFDGKSFPKNFILENTAEPRGEVNNSLRGTELFARAENNLPRGYRAKPIYRARPFPPKIEGRIVRHLP